MSLITAGCVILDAEKIRKAQRFAVKSVIATDDLEAEHLMVDDIYRSLFEIEAVFRKLKSTIEVGPVRHRRADRIHAHIMIAVMAYNLGRWLERKSGESLEWLQTIFKNLRVQKVRLGEAEFWQRVELEPAQSEVLAAMGYEEPPLRFKVSVLAREAAERLH